MPILDSGCFFLSLSKSKGFDMSTDHYLRFVNNSLVSGYNGVTPASEAAAYIHSQYRNRILSSPFPCLVAKATFSEETSDLGY
jgi:hypothetical protein